MWLIRDSDFAYFGIFAVGVWDLGASSAGLATFRVGWGLVGLGLVVWFGFGFGCVSLVALAVRVGVVAVWVLGCSLAAFRVWLCLLSSCGVGIIQIPWLWLVAFRRWFGFCFCGWVCGFSSVSGFVGFGCFRWYLGFWCLRCFGPWFTGVSWCFELRL